MSARAKITLSLAVGIVVVGVLVYVFGPVLFAGVAYPLPDQYRPSIANWSNQYCDGVSNAPNLMAGLITTESSWHPTSVSGGGAVGLTQIIPSTAAAIAKNLGVSPFKTNDLISNPDLSIRFGTYYVCTRIKDYGGNIKKGLIAYNGGGGAVIAYEAGFPVYGTVAYANKILSIQSAYTTIYGQWWTSVSGSTTTSTGQTNSTAQFNVQPKTDTSLISNVPLTDFWKGLVSNQSVAATSSSSSSGSSFLNFLRIFLPSSNQ